MTATHSLLIWVKEPDHYRIPSYSHAAMFSVAVLLMLMYGKMLAL